MENKIHTMEIRESIQYPYYGKDFHTISIVWICQKISSVCVHLPVRQHETSFFPLHIVVWTDSCSIQLNRDTHIFAFGKYVKWSQAQHKILSLSILFIPRFIRVQWQRASFVIPAQRLGPVYIISAQWLGSIVFV